MMEFTDSIALLLEGSGYMTIINTSANFSFCIFFYCRQFYFTRTIHLPLFSTQRRRPLLFVNFIVTIKIQKKIANLALRTGISPFQSVTEFHTNSV